MASHLPFDEARKLAVMVSMKQRADHEVARCVSSGCNQRVLQNAETFVSHILQIENFMKTHMGTHYTHGMYERSNEVRMRIHAGMQRLSHNHPGHFTIGSR